MNRRRRIPLWLWWSAACLFTALFPGINAWAQLRLPTLPPPTTSNVQLPSLPDNTVIRSRLDSVVADAASELDSQSQRLLRVARIKALLRAHPDELETDPNGAPVLRGQIVSLSPSPQSLQAAIDAGFAVAHDESINELDIHLVTLQAPQSMTARKALRRLRALDRSGIYEYNYVYTQSTAANSMSATPITSNSMPIAANTETYGDTRVGLIDGGVDALHPVFRNNAIHSWGCDQQGIASMHGTAVASLLVGQGEGFNGAAPGASLYTADVYCGQAVGGAMTRIAEAVAWLVRQQTPVINISLVGPDNVVLKNLISSLVARGYLVVAAVGNDGPAAPPLYPASYPGVIGVTAVDVHYRVLIEAGRGKQVMFAAPGADMVAATLHNEWVNVRGTSFAAPLVAGLLAIHINKPDPEAARIALDELISHARDLGSTGYDTTYGYGVVGESLRVAHK